MALINCPECGKEISSKAKACPHCGYPITRYNKFIKNKSEKLKKKRIKFKDIFTRKTITIVFMSIIFFVLLFFILYTYKQDSRYKSAIYNYENGKYKEAYDYFVNSSYKDSKLYYNEVLQCYVDELISNNDYEEADLLIPMITNEKVRGEIKQKLLYCRGIKAYEDGAFSLAIEIFESISGYEEANSYKQYAKIMKNIQGEWILSGNKISFPKSEEYNYAAIKINGWNASLFYCTDGKTTYDEIETSKLIIYDEKTVLYKSNTVEYNIQFKVNYIDVKVIKDKYFEKLATSREPYYTWNHYGDKFDLAFEQDKNGIPKPPQIGMTSEEAIKSTWGEPKEINKSTYSWGIKEQWCYSDNRYIYLEDGVVTSISE